MFLYAALFMTEGIGLALCRRWAEYMTIITTACCRRWNFKNCAESRRRCG